MAPDAIINGLPGGAHGSARDYVKPRIRTESPSGIIEIMHYGSGFKDVIPLWVGEGDVPTPDFICASASRSLSRGETFYTWQRGIPVLRHSLSSYYGDLYGRDFDSERFFVTGSGMQSIHLSLQCVAESGSEIILPTPAWPNFPSPMRMLELNPIMVPYLFFDNGWHLDLDRIFSCVTNKTRAIVLNSPSNPLGHVMTRDEMIAVRDFARHHGLWIISDEVYHRFWYPGGRLSSGLPPSFLDICEDEERLLLVNTFSKNWAMTGWRVGWIYAPLSLGDHIENLIQCNTSGVAVFMQRGCVTALNKGEDFVAEQRARTLAGMGLVVDALGDFSEVSFAVPEGGFYLFFKLDGTHFSSFSDMDLAKKIVSECGVGFVPGSTFGLGGEGFFRLCFARSSESLGVAMDRFCRWLRSV